MREFERAAKGDGKGKTSGCLTTKRRITQVLFTTNDTRNIIDHGAITPFPAHSHTNSAIFAGIFEPDENDLAATVCPRHRDLFGTRWRRAKGSHGRVLCSIPTALAVHKSPSTTGGCGLTFALSKFVKETHKILLPVGSGMYLCRRTPSFSVSLKNHRRIKCSHTPSTQVTRQ